MNPVTAIVTYAVVWWIVFLAALPFGVRGQWESGDAIARGSEPGAPVAPMLKKKALWTSLIAAVITAIMYVAFSFGLLDVMSLPGPDSYWE